jgi:hypothetical protein
MVCPGFRGALGLGARWEFYGHWVWVWIWEEFWILAFLGNCI